MGAIAEFIPADSQGPEKPGGVRQLPSLSHPLQRRDNLPPGANSSCDSVPGVRGALIRMQLPVVMGGFN